MTWPDLSSPVDRELILIARELSRHAFASTVRNTHGEIGSLMRAIDPTARTAAVLAEHILTGKRLPGDRTRALGSLKRLLDSIRILDVKPRTWTAAQAAAVVDAAKGIIRERGVAQLQAVSERVGDRSAQVHAILTARPTFSWLDEPGGWFWLRSVGRNPLLAQIEKILSVAPSIRSVELRAAIARASRLEGFVPPVRVLEAFCAQLDWCTVQHRVVTAQPAPDWLETLSETEVEIAGVLLEFGPVMQQRELRRRCLNAGMAESSFVRCLAESPIVWRYGRGVWGFPGVEVTPSYVSSLLPPSRTARVLQDHGWTEDGNIWLRYRLTEPAIVNGSVSVPAAIDRLLPRRTELADGTRIRLTKSQIFGLKKLLRRHKPGDDLLLVVKPGLRR